LTILRLPTKAGRETSLETTAKVAIRDQFSFFIRRKVPHLASISTREARAGIIENKKARGEGDIFDL
jgi:hypothetical protein